MLFRLRRGSGQERMAASWSRRLGASVAIERFFWTDHAELRLGERGLTRSEVEGAIRKGHPIREPNRGNADWRVYGVRSDGRKFAAVYDNPIREDARAARVVSAWPLRGSNRH